MSHPDVTLAIHHIQNSFSPQWIAYCEEHGIRYKLVDCYRNDIVDQLKECDALLWNWNQSNYKAQLFARQLIHALDRDDFIVYPNVNTAWHYDDKVGQKYLLEAMDVPLVPSYAFYDQASALAWIEETDFPKVFKLRNGAGSHNVRLIHTRAEAKRYAKQAFGRGFMAFHRASVLQDRYWEFQRDKTWKSFLNISKGLYRYLVPHPKNKELPRERNYLYAQDFVPNCDHDIRVFVIGDRAVTKKRFVRENDFRASGSGRMSWDIGDEGKACVQMGFEVTEKLQAQSVAFDFVKDVDGYKIVEISYAASEKGFPDCPGYWQRDLSWTRTPLRVEYFIIEEVLKAIARKRAEG